MEPFVRFTDNAYAKTGTYLEKKPLALVLGACQGLSKEGDKGKYGSIFVYDSSQLGEHDEDVLSTGVILCDIDYISHEECDIIFDNFEKLCIAFPAIQAIQYSYSYYNNESEKNGLHIFCKSYPINKLQYATQAKICLCIISELILKICNIDLLKIQKETQKQILDLHNTNMYQRFNLFHSICKVNEDCEEYDERIMVKLEDLIKLEEKYNINFEPESPKNTTYFGGYSEYDYTWQEKKPLLKIDRYFKIGRYTGNDIRWRISLIAETLFKDSAKDFCDKNFYYEKNSSIFSHISNYDKMTMNPIIMKWLIEEGYILKKQEYNVESYLTEYQDFIVNKIEKNSKKSLMIKAPTGTGKTYFVNSFLAKKLNACVVSPFNTNLQLYSNCFYVDSHYKGAIPKSKPVTIIWDQFMKRINELKDRYIIVDESHTLFFDRQYRDSAIKMLNYLRERNEKTICISATPSKEKELLQLEELSFEKKKQPVELIILQNLSNHELFIFNYIKKCLDNNYYDYVVFFSDRLAKKIYENFIIKGYGDKISYLRSDTKDTESFIKIRETEQLESPLTITTCIAYNGLNFKNQDKKVLIIGEIIKNYTTSGQIIQQIGRFRLSRVKALYTYIEKDEENIKEKEEKAQEMLKLYSQGVNDEFLQYDKRYLNKEWVYIKEEINSYLIEHSNIDNIIDDLSKTGYINGKVIDKEGQDEIFLKLEIKRLESDLMKEDILNDSFLNKQYNGDYSRKWSEDIRYIISNPIYKGITIENFKEIINKSTKTKLIDTIVGEIKDIIRIISVDDKQFYDVIKKEEYFKEKLSKEYLKRTFANRIKYMKRIRNLWKDKITLHEKEIDIPQFIEDIIAHEYELAHSNLVDGGKIGGKLSSPKKKVKDLKTGKIYDSSEQCAIDIGKSKSYISKYKNRFIHIK